MSNHYYFFLQPNLVFASADLFKELAGLFGNSDSSLSRILQASLDLFKLPKESDNFSRASAALAPLGYSL